jgi:hypothetical protein
MYPLTFIDEVFNVVVDHEAYLFFGRYYGYHKISIVPRHEFPILQNFNRTHAKIIK